MANHYWIISEVLFFNDKHDQKTWEFVAGTGIDLGSSCESRTPTLSEIKESLIDFGLDTNTILSQNGRVEISAINEKGESLWLIFTKVKDESEKINMFEVGRGSNPDLTIDFIKYLGQTYGKFLYYCDAGIMSLITKDKDKDEIYKQMFWNDLTVAQFKLDSSIQLTNRHFFLLGQITKGKIKEGQFMDLTMLGLAKKPKIEVIEFALKRQDGKVWEEVGLGTNELSEDEKEFIKNKGSFAIPFDIIKER